MTTKLSQSMVERLHQDHPQGSQLYDEQVAGLRLVVGKKASTFKLVGRKNDGSGQYVSLTIGRTDQISLKSARAEAQSLRLRLARGEDPRRKKSEVPTVAEALERYLASRRAFCRSDGPMLGPVSFRYKQAFGTLRKIGRKHETDRHLLRILSSRLKITLSGTRRETSAR